MQNIDLKIELSNPFTLVPLETVVTAKIKTRIDNVDYAWYIYHDNERIDMKWYSKDLKSIEVCLKKTGSITSKDLLEIVKEEKNHITLENTMYMDKENIRNKIYHSKGEIILTSPFEAII